MTIDIHFSSNFRLRDIRRWKQTIVQKEKLETAILVVATLGMITVFVARFYMLFAL